MLTVIHPHMNQEFSNWKSYDVEERARTRFCKGTRRPPAPAGRGQPEVLRRIGGVLYAIGGTDSLPNGTLPFPYRSATAGQETSVNGPKALLMAYPDPAQDRLMITYPSEVIGTLEVLDAQGRIAVKVTTASLLGFVELDVRSWAPGLYLARLVNEAGLVIGETKCMVAR